MHIIIQIFPAQIRCAVKEYFSWLPLKVFDVHSKDEYEKELLADEVMFSLTLFPHVFQMEMKTCSMYKAMFF